VAPVDPFHPDPERRGEEAPVQNPPASWEATSDNLEPLPKDARMPRCSTIDSRNVSEGVSEPFRGFPLRKSVRSAVRPLPMPNPPLAGAGIPTSLLRDGVHIPG
jgi:hypothetical protein